MSHKNKFPLLLTLCPSYAFFHVSFIFLASTATVRAFTNETDRQSLLAIKNQIVDDPLNVLSSWNNSLRFCDWHGVSCSSHHERVTILNLSSLQLAGSLSPHIGNLSFLRAIYLENNRFNGTIPAEMGRLFRLQNLSLYSNSFEGELPSSLSNCSNLRTLDVYQNNLGGEISTELGFLSSLQGLFLASNHFSGRIPPSLGNLSALDRLVLYTNNLEGSIPNELGQLSNLELIHLGGNFLSGEIPSSLYNSSVNFFAVAFNKLHGSLPNFALSFRKLQIFYAAENHFSGSIPPSIANASELVEFDIGMNNFTGSVPMNLGNIQNLQVFSVAGNQLGSNGVDDFGFFTSLSNCSYLRYLQLSDNQFGGVLPNTIGNLSANLSHLRLGKNPIHGNIPPEIGNLINLALLDLPYSPLTGSIPDSIGKLTNLQEVYLVSTSICGKIPSSIGNISGLSKLILRENRLEGDIPVSLGNCKNLIALDLSFNHLTGAIPKQIFLSSLSVGLSLAHNFLSGPLPLEVGDMKNIGILYVSENQLSGEIPSTLGGCQVLEFLAMGGNHFKGTIPSSFQQLRGIQLLDLSRNNLSGQIPRFLGEFVSIQNLDLSNNMFEGEVSIKGVFKNISLFSIVGNEKLCGGIEELRLPACPTEVLQKRRKRLSHRVLIPLVIVSIFFVLLVCLLAILHQAKRSKKQIELALPLQDLHPKLSYAELLQATNGFSSENLIGEGRYGSVYKGILNPGEQIVAVKVLKLQESGAKKSFMAECEALRNIRHRSLVRIITSCSSTDFSGNDFKALVFEFMPNGTLQDWLHPLSSEQQQRRNLSLVQRINVAIDVASVLDYLHHHCETAITHCDLKPSNVLLDNELCARLGDFGLARILLASIHESVHAHSISIGIRGTVGYIAPEYGMGGEVSTQGDAYSYGILLLEIFTGKGPTDNIFADDFGLHDYAKMALPGQVMKIVDPRLLLQLQRGYIARIEECVRSILQIGVSCSAKFPSDRMNLRDVLIELYQIKNVFLEVER